MSPETLGLAGFVLVLATFVLSNWFLGGRRWHANYDAEHTRAERLAATLTEKDQIVEGQSARLRRLDEVVQELGGERVAQKIVESQSENLRAFKEIAESMTTHEQRAADRHKALIELMQVGYDHLATVNQDGFERLARAFREGGRS